MKRKTYQFVMVYVCICFHTTYSSVPLLILPTVNELNVSPETAQILSEIAQRRNQKVQTAPYGQKCLQKIIKELKALPIDKQPVHMAEALKLMIRGSQVWKLLEQEKIYDACGASNIKPNYVKTLKIAFNKSDVFFWHAVQDDYKFQYEMQKQNITFSKEVFFSLQYNIFFRMTYARMHIADDHTWQQFKQAYQQALIAVSWYLFAQVIIQGTAFTSGMIVLADPEATLFKFIDGYGELVSPGYRFYSGLHPHSLWAMEAYTRKSSHWKDRKSFNDTNFGIDLKDAQGKQINAFPYNKSHLLFGMLASGMTFLKWEEYGTTINFMHKDFSALRHTARYFQKQGQEDTRLNCREKVPQDVMFMFKSLYLTKLTKHQIDQIQLFGISAILKILQGDDLALFMDYLTKHKKYSPDTVFLRKGNEIILQQRKFVTFTEFGCRLEQA